MNISISLNFYIILRMWNKFKLDFSVHFQVYWHSIQLLLIKAHFMGLLCGYGFCFICFLLGFWFVFLLCGVFPKSWNKGMLWKNYNKFLKPHNNDTSKMDHGWNQAFWLSVCSAEFSSIFWHRDYKSFCLNVQKLMFHSHWPSHSHHLQNCAVGPAKKCLA